MDDVYTICGKLAQSFSPQPRFASYAYGFYTYCSCVLVFAYIVTDDCNRGDTDKLIAEHRMD